MLRVSKLADYATVLMAYMALKFNELHNARDIAAATHIALPTVSKILKLMAKANLVISTRGAKGGYSLARAPEAIDITEVLQAVDGNFGMTDCSQHNNDCQIEPYCSISCNWQLISETIHKALKSLTLAEMTKPLSKRQVPLTQEIFVNAIKHKHGTPKTDSEAYDK